MASRNQDDRYLTDEYVTQNPTWDEQDSPWKAVQVNKILKANSLQPHSIVEVGCGAGGILSKLRSLLGLEVLLDGFDIAPTASKFWGKHKSKNVNFYLEDFVESTKSKYDLLLLMDVIEHLENPFDFLRRLKDRSTWFVLHIPLDISAQAVMRKKPLPFARKKVGHIHSYNKDIALMLLDECGYKVCDWFYTASSIDLPNKPLSAKIMSIPRWLLFRIAPDFSVRLLGGYSLLVLANKKES